MGSIGGTSTAEIDAPIAKVYALVADVEIAPSWQEGLDEMRVVDRDEQGRAVHCITKSDAKVREITSEVIFTYEPETALHWKQIKGDTKSVQGSWLLEDLGNDRTKATYKLEVDPGRILGMLLMGPVEGILRGILVGARADELKKLAESS